MTRQLLGGVHTATSAVKERMVRLHWLTNVMQRMMHLDQIGGYSRTCLYLGCLLDGVCAIWTLVVGITNKSQEM